MTRGQGLAVSTDMRTEDVAEGKPKERRCPKHNVPYDVESDCSTCHGEGQVWDDDPGMGSGYLRCWSCGGSGVSPFLDCWVCLEEDDDY